MSHADDDDVPDAEDLICRLCGGLAPADREAFRRAAENALAESPQCWGPGSIHRALVPLWRQFFRPRDDRPASHYRERRPSKLIDAAPLRGDRDRRRVRNRLKLVV